ncbi:MAG: dihydrofolate reductase, partial [Pirellulaceae bacterium]|nr:dihydrofolate reductase [Pirellulaceae bacterium]
RKTFDSIGRPLPGRRTVVITRNRDWSHEGVEVADGPESALEAAGSTPAFVVGGAQIYDLMLPKCREICLTRVWSSVVGDTYLELDLSQFSLRETMRLPITARDSVPTEFLRLDRRSSSPG